MNRRKIWGYGVGALGKDLANIVISSYLLVFYTNVLGISAAAGVTIMMVTKIWDAINDPMMGIVADKTKTRWGKFRPYLLFVPIPLAVCAVLTFTPVSFSYTGKLIWAAVTYTLTNTLFTCYDVPMLGMVPSLSDSPRDRNAGNIGALLHNNCYFAWEHLRLSDDSVFRRRRGGTESEERIPGFSGDLRRNIHSWCVDCVCQHEGSGGR